MGPGRLVLGLCQGRLPLRDARLKVAGPHLQPVPAKPGPRGRGAAQQQHFGPRRTGLRRAGGQVGVEAAHRLRQRVLGARGRGRGPLTVRHRRAGTGHGGQHRLHARYHGLGLHVGADTLAGLGDALAVWPGLPAGAGSMADTVRDSVSCFPRGPVGHSQPRCSAGEGGGGGGEDRGRVPPQCRAATATRKVNAPGRVGGIGEAPAALQRVAGRKCLHVIQRHLGRSKPGSIARPGEGFVSSHVLRVRGPQPPGLEGSAGGMGQCSP